jgi:hypothetical protein
MPTQKRVSKITKDSFKENTTDSSANNSFNYSGKSIAIGATVLAAGLAALSSFFGSGANRSRTEIVSNNGQRAPIYNLPYFFPHLDNTPASDDYPEFFDNIKNSIEKLSSDSHTLEELIVQLHPIEQIKAQKNQIGTQKLSIQQEYFIKQALMRSFSKEGLQSVLSDPSFRIFVAPPDYFIARFGSTNFDGIYDYDRNFICIAQHLVPADPANVSSELQEQLTAVLSDEVSLAYMRYTKLKKIMLFLQQKLSLEVGNTVREDGSFILDYLWTNKSEFNKLNSAYKQFKDKVNEYETLVKNHRHLDDKQLKSLNDYNRAIESFVPLRYGSEKITDVDRYAAMRKAGKLTSYIEPGSQQPSKGNIKELRRWNRDCFFQQMKNLEQDLHNQAEVPHYAGKLEKDPRLELLESISNFVKLSPQIQQRFGLQLCEALDDLHGLIKGEYCSRALSL